MLESLVIRKCAWLLLFVLLSSAACRTAHEPRRVARTIHAQDHTISQKSRAQEAFLRANDALDQRDWPRAIAAYRQALKYAPDRWDVHMNLAIAYSANNQFPEAIASMENALHHGGDEHHLVYINLGNIYQNRGLYGESINAYRAALAVYGKLDLEILLNIGAAYIFLHDYEAAQLTLRKAGELSPTDPRPAHSLALIHQAKEDWQQALIAYEQVHQIDPHYALSYFNKGQLYYQLNRYSEAIEALQRYLELEPEGPSVRRARQLIKASKQNISQ